MTTKEFDKIINQQIEFCLNVLNVKSNDYNQDKKDRLDCFKAASTLQNISLKSALGGMMAKHTISIYQMLNSNEKYNLEKWEEKITDHINYLLILKTIIIEEQKLKEEKN